MRGAVRHRRRTVAGDVGLSARRRGVARAGGIGVPQPDRSAARRLADRPRRRRRGATATKPRRQAVSTMLTKCRRNSANINYRRPKSFGIVDVPPETAGPPRNFGKCDRNPAADGSFRRPHILKSNCFETVEVHKVGTPIVH